MKSPRFHHTVASVLHQIVDKSGRNDFKIIQTGHPRFFNDDTPICNYSTVYFWQPGYHWFHRSGDCAYLSNERRAKLNQLTDELNRQLQIIINDVNRDYHENRVLFADPNPAFEGHRFCEPNIYVPDANNQNNWFFLASWLDKTPEGMASVGAAADALAPDLDTMTLPDGKTCAKSRQWSDQLLCDLQREGIVSKKGNGQKCIVLKSTVKGPDGRDIPTKEIGYFKPTNWVKTFHPDSRGHRALRDLVQGLW